MAGQLINRGDRKWLVRIYLGRDVVTGKRKYHNKTVYGTKRDAQKYLNGVLREIDLGRFVEPQGQRRNLSQLFGTVDQLCPGGAGTKAHLQGDDP